MLILYLFLGERLSVLEPNDLGLGRSVNNTDDLGLVVFAGVNERLLLLNVAVIYPILSYV